MATARDLYIDAIKQMLRETSIENIRVRDLCERTHTHRHTFYYHFKDKYDLVSCVFHETVDSILARYDGVLTHEAGEQVLTRLKEERLFYKNALMYSGQNSLHNYLTDYCFILLCGIVERNKGKLTQADRIYCRYHMHAMVGLIEDWIMNDPPVSAHELIDQIRTYLPDALRTGK